MRTVEIDRIRMTGLEMTPERADRVRGLVEAELRRLLEGGRWPEDLSGGEISRLDAAILRVDTAHGDYYMANGLARSIARSLRDVG